MCVWHRRSRHAPWPVRYARDRSQLFPMRYSALPGRPRCHGRRWQDAAEQCAWPSDPQRWRQRTSSRHGQAYGFCIHAARSAAVFRCDRLRDADEFSVVLTCRIKAASSIALAGSLDGLENRPSHHENHAVPRGTNPAASSSTGAANPSSITPRQQDRARQSGCRSPATAGPTSILPPFGINSQVVQALDAAHRYRQPRQILADDFQQQFAAADLHRAGQAADLRFLLRRFSTASSG